MKLAVILLKFAALFSFLLIVFVAAQHADNVPVIGPTPTPASTADVSACSTIDALGTEAGSLEVASAGQGGIDPQLWFDISQVARYAPRPKDTLILDVFVGNVEADCGQVNPGV